MAAPNLRAVDATLPDPPYPEDTATKGWKFILDIPRIKRSDTWVRTPREMRPWLIMTWMAAWEQIPTGSLPDDHVSVAGHIDMDAELFADNSGILLRGFVRYSDGRIYHPVIVDQAFDMLVEKTREAKRKAEYRAAQRKARGRDEVETCPTHVPPQSPACPAHNAGDMPACPTTVPIPSASGTGTGTGTGTIQEEKKEKDLLRKSKKKAEKPKTQPTTRGARLNLEKLPAEWQTWAMDKRPDLDPDLVFDSFRDYWISTPGQKGVKADWFATWRNWCRRQDAPNAKRKCGGFKTKSEIIAERNKASGDAWLAKSSAENIIDGEFEVMGQ